MSAASLAGFLAIAGVAAYIQTLTGFALGLLVMGAVGLTGFVPLPEAAVIVSVLVLVNAAQVLAKGWRDVARRELALVLAAGVPMLPVGFWLLDRLAAASIHGLRIVLGMIIAMSALQLVRRPEPLARRSPAASFLVFGGIAGLMSGLFSTAGPPLVFHFYRQTLPVTQVRETLVTVFAVNAVLRLAIATGSGGVASQTLWTALLAAPVVIAATAVARRWPPPASPATMRRVAFTLLLLSAASLAVPSLLHVIGTPS